MAFSEYMNFKWNYKIIENQFFIYTAGPAFFMQERLAQVDFGAQWGEINVEEQQSDVLLLIVYFNKIFLCKIYLCYCTLNSRDKLIYQTANKGSLSTI